MQPSQRLVSKATLILICFTFHGNGFLTNKDDMNNAPTNKPVLNAASLPVANKDVTHLASAFTDLQVELSKQAIFIKRLEETSETQSSALRQLEEKVDHLVQVIQSIESSRWKDSGLSTGHNNSPLKATNYGGDRDTEESVSELNHSSEKKSGFFKTCEDIRSSHPLSESGLYMVDPDGPGGDFPIDVVCNMTNGATQISHDTEKGVKADPCSSADCYEHSVDYYNVTLHQITELTRLSTTCYQEITYEFCLEEPFTDSRPNYTSLFWKNLNGDQREIKTVKISDYVRGTRGSFSVTHVEDLPVTEITSQGPCTNSFQVGKLVCLGNGQASEDRLTFERAGSQMEARKPSFQEIRGSSRNRSPSRHRPKPKNSSKSDAHFEYLPGHEGCLFNLERHSPQYPPLLFDEKNNIIHPILKDKTRIITLKANANVTVRCLGGRRESAKSTNVLKTIGTPKSVGRCKANSTLYLNTTEIPYDQLGCTSQNQEFLKEEGPCANRRGTLIRVGWQVDHHFIPLYETCHDKTTTLSYYSTHIIVGKSVDADDKSNRRPSFRQAGYYPGVDVNAAMSPTRQMETVTRIVGSETLAAKYIDQKKNFFLARGHLAPDGDFIDAASQDATYYYFNTAPQWQSFNGGNWNMLETAIRQIAMSRDIDLIVYTGTFGAMKLIDANGTERPLYLARDQNNNELLPVPMYFWKLIRDPMSGTATAVIGINNPHLDRVTPGHIICPNVCDRIPWIKWKLNDISKGYMFCCTAQELHKAVPFTPDLKAPLFL